MPTSGISKNLHRNLLQCVMLVTLGGQRAVVPAHSVRTGSTHAVTKPNVPRADRTGTQEGTRGQGRKKAAVSNRFFFKFCRGH